MATLQDARLTRDALAALPPSRLSGRRVPEDYLTVHGRQTFNTAGEQHDRLRNAFVPFFTRSAIQRHRPFLAALAADLVDELAGRREIDLVTDYAGPYVMRAICYILGVPADLLPTLLRQVEDLTGPNDPDLPWMRRQFHEFNMLIAETIDYRRRHPTDYDVVSVLLQAAEPRDLALHELAAMVGVLIGAGSLTTRSLITSGYFNLLTNPGAIRAFGTLGSASERAVNELLRIQSPVAVGIPRVAQESCTLGGQRIEEGEVVRVMHASANRDPAVFAHPDHLDVRRARKPHLAFGWGKTYCLGAHLARLQTQIAFHTLCARLPRLHLAVPVEEIRWRPTVLVRGPQTLPLRTL
ncbi:cytochrome P450 [Nocardia goodfellowii]|uniref:Cytochrome P450 n=1 Tax=Nocardia goodfellowii TaxID=882446 RepID=A0ABS4QKH4_9NOCA|nr:cytochrome P450 [Nocardia goodfellowii]MBP2191544.1 cytochrome P450 [Nocardia goodfellowii]